MHLHLFVVHGVQLPSARVPRAVDAAPVSRRHLEFDALGAHRPGAAEASEAQRHVRRRAAHVGGGRRGSGLGSLALGLLGLQHHQRLANLLVARSQVWLLLPQLGEQWLEAEVGIGHSQPADGLEEGVGRAGFAHTRYWQGKPPAQQPSCRHRRGRTASPSLREGKTRNDPDTASDCRHF
eukprot:scaffold104660_cov60-Phaeocystis_antarctica.AAC.3